MRYILISIILLPCLAQAQADTEGLAIMQPITTLFTGMNRGDSAMVHSAFTEDATMASISKDQTGKVIVKKEPSISGFLKAVGSPHKEPWSEPIWNARIEVDGEFAQVWTPYAFYVGKNLSHCGVDSFQLIKVNGAWKIFYIVDTRHKEGCAIPKTISDQFK